MSTQPRNSLERVRTKAGTETQLNAEKPLRSLKKTAPDAKAIDPPKNPRKHGGHWMAVKRCRG